MYRSFFGLRVLPFGASPDPRFLYMMPQIREALACLQYGIAARKGFVVMTGEVGTGKTTLLKTVLSSFHQGSHFDRVCFQPAARRARLSRIRADGLRHSAQQTRTQIRHADAAQSLADRPLPQRGICAPLLSTKLRISPGNFLKRFAC